MARTVGGRLTRVTAVAGALAAVALRGAEAMVTTPVGYVSTRYQACAFAPPVAPGIVITDDNPITSATVTITTGNVPAEDRLQVDPNPDVECSWQRTCGPCFPLTVSNYDATNGLTISGTASAAVYQSCLSRVAYDNSAYGGTETIGQRTVLYSVAGTTTTTTTGTASIAAEDGDACGTQLQTYYVVLGNPANQTQTYYATCSAVCTADKNYALLSPRMTMTEPNAPADSAFILAYNIIFAPCQYMSGCPGVYDATQDFLGVLPDPSDATATKANPCPGLLVVTNNNGNGINITSAEPGAGTPAAMSACVQRIYYYNTAANTGGTVTTGTRWFTVAIQGPVSATLSTTSGVSLVMPLDTTSPCATSTCQATGVNPGASPAGTASPNPSDLAASSASSVVIGVGTLVGLAGIIAMRSAL